MLSLTCIRMQEPTQIKIGQPYYVTKLCGKKRRKVLDQDSIVYIPIKRILQALLQRLDIRLAIRNGPACAPNLLQDLCDGELYEKHPVLSCSQNKVQITAYFDEIELCNPLGSHTKVHKIGCLFFSIGNIHPKFRSQLKTMFLVALATAPVINTHGIDEVLRPFVEELQDLHKNKLDVYVNGTCEKYDVALLSFLADNLAAHQVGGFKESMSFAHRICRSCMTTTEKAQTNFVEANFELRTPETHVKQCTYLEQSQHQQRNELSKIYGINRKSVLENIPVAQNLPHDIMHDLLEGVIPYELKVMLTHFISNCHYFTLKQLNEQLLNYDFGYTEASDKPSALHDVKPESSLRQSAAQMWLFATVLPLLIGDLIPETSEHWNCFLLLLKLKILCQIDTLLMLY